jgi:uncharacterized protein YkwD
MSRILSAMVCALVLLTATLALPRSAEATRSSDAVVKWINKARASRGLPRLRRSRTLSGSAFRYAGWMMSHDRFGHSRRIRASRRFSRLGEALAYNAGWRLRARRMVRQLLRSPPHRTLLLSRSFRYVGAGHSRGRFGLGRATVWVVHLGAR